MESHMTTSVALITGAGSGIGRQLALLLAAKGHPVAALDLNAGALQSLEKELQSHNRPCACAVADVTDRAVLFAAVRELEARLGPTDLLIASAGVGLETSALDF